MSPFMRRPVLIMKTTMLITKTAAVSMTQPSTISVLRFRRETTMAAAMLPMIAATSPE